MSKKTTVDSFSSSVETLKVISNDKTKNVELAGEGFSALYYYESILSDTVKASIHYVETGSSVEGKNVIEGLPLVGTEKVEIKFSDAAGEKIGDTPKLELYVNKVTPLASDTRKEVVKLDLVSKEFELNEKVRLRKRYDGKISDHIKTILTDTIGEGLGTEKNIEIEDTANNFNFIGNNKKSFWTLNWLSKKAVSAENQKLGKSAGYFFYETSEGYFFKSIDGLLSQEPKRSIIYNESSDGGDHIPPRYDYQAFEYEKNNLIEAQKKLMIGAFSTKVVLFDPFKAVYEVVTPNLEETQEQLKLAGKDLPKLNDELNIPGKDREFSRATYYLLDKGTLPTGDTNQQIEKSDEENFEYRSILNQSIMRYNQFLSFTATITIPGDFTLHAGDAIFLDVPLLEEGDTTEPSAMDSGLYIITDLTHYISPSETLTRLGLVRDSFGRKGKPTGKI